MLDDAIALQGAEYGNVQLLVQDELVLVANRHLPIEFVYRFRRVKDGGTACARALRSGRPIVIANVDGDGEFAAFRSEAARAGFRAVQSTPLVTQNGNALGVLSTHFANDHEPTGIEMETLEAYGQLACEYCFEVLGERTLATTANQMQERLILDALAAEKDGAALARAAE